MFKGNKLDDPCHARSPHPVDPVHPVKKYFSVIYIRRCARIAMCPIHAEAAQLNKPVIIELNLTPPVRSLHPVHPIKKHSP